MAADIRVPRLSESVTTTATVARWLKKVGDAVAEDEPLVELETDKVTVEVNAPAEGTLSSLAADEGTEVEVGALLGTIQQHSLAEPPAKPPSIPAPTDSPAGSTRVFIVHGHDEAAREGVARLIERAGLEAVILKEQPGEGKTILERFEKHSATADFAVVLLTPDDVGGPRGVPPDQLKLRARQNVIAELFFFIGKLGRDRVCALVKGDVELPSDLAGVVYERMDEAGHWRLALAREMASAGLSVDFNKVFRR